MGNNEKFEDLMSDINDIGKGYGFKNGIDWAFAAQQAGEISYNDYRAYENCHNLRVRYSHGAARDIHISNETYANAERYYRDIKLSRLRKRRQAPKLPEGTFRVKPFIKEFRWKGYGDREYYFRFLIVYEYQKRAYDDGTRFEGYGYTIYVKEAPYKQWCMGYMDFHFYNLPVDNPSICWNRLITDFSDANAVMITWSNRYKTILDRLFQNKSIDELKLNRSSNRRAILPTGTFRICKKMRRKKQSAKTIHISQNVYDEIMNILGTRKPELGGMLGWKDDQDYIDTFVFDKNAKVGTAEYNPNTQFLMKVMGHEWEKKSIFLGGFVHSHPRNCGVLSNADIEYAKRIMDAFDMKYMFMPIVTSSYEYKSELHPYIVDRQGNARKCSIEIFQDAHDASEDLMDIDPVKLSEINAQFDQMEGVKPLDQKVCADTLEQNETFARIESVIDINHMKQCSIIGIGCGGARGFYEDMARIGVGHFYLMDADISSKSNIASQNGYLSEVGVPKVEAVKKRLLDINDSIDVQIFQQMLDDSISDEWLKKNIFDKVIPQKTILCAFTDDFWAQERAQELAIKFNLPYLSAQHHQYGATSEVFYWYPGITKYTAKDVFADRYTAYHNGYKNDVTSEGSPIFNTTRLNALCGKIATGILMFSCNIQSDFCSFLKLQANKNLILIRQKSLECVSKVINRRNYASQSSVAAK